MTGESGTRDAPPPRPEREDERVYWCDVCKATFSSKRCPQCGLKLKRVG